MSRIEELEKRLAADPNSRIFVQLAEEYRKAGLLEQAIEVCEEGIQKHPQYPSARVALGRALLEAESYDRASAEFEAVLKQVPDNILANKFLGETYHRLGRLDEALKKYKVAQTLAPEDPELGERIETVQTEMAGGGKPSVAEASAGKPAPTGKPSPPPEPERAAQPPPRPSEAAPPPAVPPPPPPSEAAPPPEVPPPPPPPAPEPELPAEAQGSRESRESQKAQEEVGSEEEAARLDDDLPPIPLVDVDEPMVLEDRFAAPPTAGEPTSEPAAPPPPETAPSPREVETFDEPEPLDAGALVSEPPAAPEPPAAEMPSPPAPGTDEPESLDGASFVEPILDAEPEPETAAPPPAGPPPASATPADIETRTMAELYASQGHLDEAIAVYEKLLERRPDELAYRSRVDELRMLAQATRGAGKSPPPPPPEAPAAPSRPESGADEKTVEALDGWLRAIKKSRGSRED